MKAPNFSRPTTQRSVQEQAEAEAEERASEIADKASALFNFAYGLGAVLGPILGGVLYDATDFATTSDVFACIATAFAFLYFGLVFAPAIFCHKKDEEEVEIKFGDDENYQTNYDG